VDRLLEGIRQRYAEREQQIGPATMRMLERYLLLWKIDSKWKDHLYNMDHLREGIGLRAYGQMDPKVEYTREARAMFYDMLESVRQDVADMVLKVDIRPEDRLDEGGMWSGGTEVHAPASGVPQDGTRRQQEAAIAGTQQAEKPRPVRKSAPAVGRNDPCPCGSGQKYKRCCGKAG
jgi:preprotein translocase subunit SecA